MHNISGHHRWPLGIRVRTPILAISIVLYSDANGFYASSIHISWNEVQVFHIGQSTGHLTNANDSLKAFRRCSTMGVPTIAGGRRQSQALEMPFFGQKPLLRAPCNCIMACDPSMHIFSCALCHESSFHHIFILTEETGFVPESNNCIGR